MSELFSINISDDSSYSDGEEVAVGKIRINDFEETLSCPLCYWRQDNYAEQWKEGLRRLIEGNASSALVTSMYDPKLANFIVWWLMYPMDEMVFIQNQVLFLEDIEGDFSLEKIYQYIPLRETINEDGETISEWVVSREAVSKFLLDVQCIKN